MENENSIDIEEREGKRLYKLTVYPSNIVEVNRKSFATIPCKSNPYWLRSLYCQYPEIDVNNDK